MRFLLAAAAAALVLAPSALAQGGSPSQSFPLSPDKAFSGDTSRQQADGSNYYREFLSVNLKAGDFITVDWSQPIGGQNELYLLPPDTNDNNFTQVDSIASRGTDSTGHDEFTGSIIRSGTYYFDLEAHYDPGAYSLTIHIRRGSKPGDNIAHARAIAKSGQRYNGDLSTKVPDSSGNHREFWRLLLHPGDKVYVSWGVPTGSSVNLYLLPPGTTDGNLGSTDAIAERSPNSNGQDAFSFTAARKGWHLFDFVASNPGAYHFRVVVKHK